MTTISSAVNTVRSEVETSNRAFEAAMARKDAAGLAKSYTEQARALPPNGPIVIGKSDIQTFWQQVLDMGITGIEMNTEEVEQLGDTAWEVGQAVMKVADNQVLDTVKYIIIWKRVDGRWLKHRGTWNSNTPA